MHLTQRGALLKQSKRDNEEPTRKMGKPQVMQQTNIPTVYSAFW